MEGRDAMINRIGLYNFKAHESLEIKNIPQISVLIGRNNTGKSAVLHAAAIPKYGWREDPNLPIGSAPEAARKPGKEFRVELSYRGTPPTALAISLGPQGLSQEWGGGRSTDAAQGVFYLSALRTTSRNFPYGPLTEDVGVSGEQTYNVLHQLKANDDQRFVSILEWLSRMNLGITFLATPTMGGPMGALEPTSYGTRTNIVVHGSGTWSALPIVVQGVLARNGQTLLIEEPESHLHRAAIDTLWHFLADCSARGIQTICTTHSLDLLVSMNQAIEAETLSRDSAIYHFMRDEKGKTSVVQQDPSVFRTIANTIKRDLAGHDL